MNIGFPEAADKRVPNPNPNPNPNPKNLLIANMQQNQCYWMMEGNGGAGNNLERMKQSGRVRGTTGRRLLPAATYLGLLLCLAASLLILPLILPPLPPPPLMLLLLLPVAILAMLMVLAFMPASSSSSSSSSNHTYL